MGRFIFVSFSVMFFFFSRHAGVSQSSSGPTNILPWAPSVCVHFLCVCARDICTYHPCNFAFLASLCLCPLTARLLYSTQLYHFCRVEWKKRESGNFIIITSHFCNLYAMRTLCACSYNQVCRNHVRCFTNSWGDGSSSGGDGFPCC